jgi:DNA (cytosine-5)-methyltransferase 1
MKMMSLFDGSGGFPLAASLCGIEPVYASEVEPYPIAVTRSRFQNMIHLGDVSKVHGGDLEPVDVITFGSPCQDMSIAGKRAGIKHEENGDEETTRSGLFMEAARIIQEMREATNGLYPTFAVWENVPGAFSSNKGEDFRLVLQTLIKIVEPEADVPGVPKGGWAYADCWMGPGWSIAYRTFDAQYWGVPQRRRRIYLVLDLRGRRAGKVLFERKGLRGHFAAGRAPWEGTSADATGSAGVCDNNCLTPWDVQSRRVYSTDGPWPEIYAGEGGGHGYAIVQYTMKIRSGCEGGGKGPLIQEDKSATLATNNDQYLFVPVVLDDQGGQQITARDDGISPTVVFMAHGQANAEVCENCAPCLNCNHEQPIVFIRYIVRRLTPTECARLQGFPDRWGDIDPLDISDEREVDLWREIYKTYCIINGLKVSASILSKPERLKKWHDKLHTDSAEYKMWGNGIALPNALYVMQGIEEVMNHA